MSGIPVDGAKQSLARVIILLFLISAGTTIWTGTSTKDRRLAII